jgi:HEAT repeat protein
VNKPLDDVLVQLRSSNPKDRVVALAIIGKEHYYAATDQVIGALQDPEKEVRSIAAWALDLMSSPATIPALLEAMYDATFDVRSNAGWALVHLARRFCPELVLADIIDILRDESNEEARQMAYLALLHIGGEDAENAIKSYWR